MVVVVAAAFWLREFGLAPKTNQAERAFDTSAENFSMCGDVRRRVRWRECALEALTFRGDDSDGTAGEANKSPVRGSDSDDAALARARNESLTAKNAFLS
jgi:hypothetical protein